MEYESSGDRNETLSIKEYLEDIKPYFEGMIISKNLVHGKLNLQQQLTLYFLETLTKSNNIEIMIDAEVDEFIE